MVPSPEKIESGESDRERLRHFLARRYAGELLQRALDENEYRSTTMP